MNQNNSMEKNNKRANAQSNAIYKEMKYSNSKPKIKTNKKQMNIDNIVAQEQKQTMNFEDNENESVPSSDVSSGGGAQAQAKEAQTDIDLAGIPPFILDLQRVQPTLNIMTCGDVSHGKSTLLAALSGEKTGKHSKEKKQNMTIRLGYTSCKIYKCLRCPRPDCYFSAHSDAKTRQCPNCHAAHPLLVRHLSFVDVPGHSQLMQTMVSATSIADGAILVVDASKNVPGKQCAQHCDAMNLLGLMRQNKMIVAQNKIDLINPSKACLNHEAIRSYLRSFGNDDFAFQTPIVPISAQSKLNIDALCSLIIGHFPKYSPKLLMAEQQSKQHLHMNIIRSFDVNRPRTLMSVADIDRIAGGVLGGAVLEGHVSLNQEIEIRPGLLVKKKQKNEWKAVPIRSKVKSLKYGKNAAKQGYCGGNVGIETNIDPSLTKSDRMSGHIVVAAAHPNPPPIFNTFLMSYCFLSGQKRDFVKSEVVRLNIGCFKMKATVERLVNEFMPDDRGALVVLEAPICARVGAQIGICRKNDKKEWSFVGGGIVRKAKKMRIETDKKMIDGKKERIKVRKERGVKDESEVCVHLRYQQRTGRKGLTTVVGLPKNVNLKKLMVKMKKTFNCGATLVDDENIIQIQGDLRTDIANMIVKRGLVTKPQVVVHGH